LRDILNNINILIPMAGLGSRFAEKGYTLPKPLIKIFGKPMIQLVVDSLGIDGNYIFLVQKDHRVKYHLDDVLDEIAPGCKIVEIDGLTDGAARTTLFAKDLIDNDTPLLIANSDQVVAWSGASFTATLASVDAVALFRANESKWSYSKIENGFITEIAEKKVISDNANVGIYGWSKGSDYVKYAEQMIAKDIRTNNEFYIAPVYNEAIADGRKVAPYFVEEMHGIGTPEDMNNYINGVINAKDRT
jgi:NDP-sugar pyrophosphorylase family protein